VICFIPLNNECTPSHFKKRLRDFFDKASTTYSVRGGGKCATQLRQVLDGLKKKAVATMPAFSLAHELVEANRGTIEPAPECTDIWSCRARRLPS
jgi:hypothetical protein